MFIGAWKKILATKLTYLGKSSGVSWYQAKLLAAMIPGAIANFYSQGYWRRYKVLLWKKKYNYVLSAGFTSGLVFSSIIIFFAVEYKDKHIQW